MVLNFLMPLFFVIRGKGTKCWLDSITSSAINNVILISQDRKYLEV